MRRSVGIAFIVAILVCGSVSAATSSAVYDPSRLINSLEEAPGLLVATVTEVEAVQFGGWVATLDVERVLRGDERHATGSKRIEIAWEEPVPELPPRIETGRRILVAISPMDTASIWKQRVPDARRRERLVSIAERANAFVIRPSGEELTDLEHYFALSRDARRGSAGVVYLAALSARAQPKLAIASIATLGGVPLLSNTLESVSANHLCDAIMREGRDPQAAPGTSESDVAASALALAEKRKLASLRPVLQARIAEREPDVPAVLYAALGAIDGKIPDELALALLSSASIEHRLAAARWASGEKGVQRIRHLIRWDPEPAVRAAAIQRLVQLESSRGLDDAIRGYEDPASEVRLATMRSIATLDPEAIRELEYVVESGSVEAARGAIVTLSMMGVEAHQLLLEISVQHQDESLRTLAGVAVGKPLGHAD